jgi:molybdopterin synthase catalytic subunit
MKADSTAATEERIKVSISELPIEPSIAEEFARTADGAVVTFAGVVRDESEGRDVRELQYEAYDEMAETEMRKIAEDACDRWPIGRVLMVHRTGHLAIGDVSVLIAVSAPHRGEAFDACEFCIDTLKQTVPIWKKEHFADGESVWVNHP